MQTFNKQSVAELKPENLKGEVGTVSLGTLSVGVKIVDTRVRFGHLDLLVKPLNGSGQEWIEHHRVTVMA